MSVSSTDNWRSHYGVENLTTSIFHQVMKNNEKITVFIKQILFYFNEIPETSVARWQARFNLSKSLHRQRDEVSEQISILSTLLIKCQTPKKVDVKTDDEQERSDEPDFDHLVDLVLTLQEKANGLIAKIQALSLSNSQYKALEDEFIYLIGLIELDFKEQQSFLSKLSDIKDEIKPIAKLFLREKKIWTDDEARVKLAKQKQRCQEAQANEGALPFDAKLLLTLDEIKGRLPSLKIESWENVGVAESIGIKSFMEDRWLVNLDFPIGNHSAELFAVFDGHCVQFDASESESPGALVAEKAKAMFPEVFKQQFTTHVNEATIGTILTAIEQTCIKLDHTFFAQNQNEGTTCVALLRLNGQKWIISIGDSRAIQTTKDRAEALTYPANPDSENISRGFTKRNHSPPTFYSNSSIKRGVIYENKKFVTALAFLRCIGDYYKNQDGIKIYSPIPVVTLSEDQSEYLILSSDGLSIPSDLIAIIVHDLDKKRATPVEIAAKLVYYQHSIKRKGLRDNITVIVVKT